MGPDFRGLCLYWPSPMHLGRKPGQQVCVVEDALHMLANRKKRETEERPGQVMAPKDIPLASYL